MASKEFRPARSLASLPGLRNAGLVAEGIYRGASPSGRGVLTLREMGVRTVVSLRHYHGASEEKRLRAQGIRYVHLVIASRKAPSDAVLKRFLEIVSDPASRPVYFHCWRGKDRTGAMCAAYRMAVQGWDLSAARREMDLFGFFKGWKNLSAWVDAFPLRASAFGRGLR